jgi:SNF2 family DNA or RNA helicase
MSEIVQVKLTTRTKSGTLIRSPATLEYADGRIYFLKSPFSLKDEIKAMAGSRWHGYDEEDGRKIWSVEDSQRNRFQLGFLMGEDVYEWFNRDVVQHTYEGLTLNGKPAEPMPHQRDMADHFLTYHYGVKAAEMGVGKTLSAQLVIQKSGVKFWWWVGPKSSLPNIRREFRKWGFNFDTGDIHIEMMTYEELTRRMDEWKPGDPVPQGVIFDESSRLKGATSQRTRAAQMLGNLIRDKYGFDGYVIEMSGTPSPKSPIDWWSQTEIAWPGFLREGSPKAMEQRMAFLKKVEYDSGVFPKRVGWRDDEKKCNVCGEYEELGPHELDGDTDPAEYHPYVPSINEVALLHDRLQGLVIIKHKKDCLTLPDKRYRKVICKPSSSVLRVAQAMMQAAPNTITGLTWLRELSDGFQYKEVKDGETRCTHCEDGKVDEWFTGDRAYRAIDMLDDELVAKLEKRSVDCPRCKGTKLVDKIVRITKEVPCPKDKALEADLETCEETGRIVIFAGFTGSVDRIANFCRKKDWAVVRCDGRGFEVTVREDKQTRVITSSGDEALAYWANLAENPRVAFVAHPESGGMSLTLVEARMAIFWSNSFKPEYRSQAEDRIHRKGMDENLGCEIVDYVHLPTDDRVIQVIRENRRLELMSMGEFSLDHEVEVGSNDSLYTEAA